jgi:hypothetical protein
VRVARALAGLPQTSAAMSRGELSFSQVRALTRAADAECELELLEHACTMTAAELEKLCRAWKKLGRADEMKLEERIHRSRSVSVFPDEEGAYVIRGRLEPEVGARLMRAIEAASDALYRGSVPETTPEQRRADALALLAERALAVGFGGEGDARDPAVSAETAGVAPAPPVVSGTRAERYTVVLHVDDATLSEDGNGERSNLEDGTRASAETARRLSCDASVVRVRRNGRGGGGPALDIEGKRRTVPLRLRRALEVRDRGCRFPGCGSRFTDAHHIQHWADGGPTRLDNLVLLCRTHHRLLHEGGFRLEPDPAHLGRPIFHDPRGVRIPEVPPRMSIDGHLLQPGRVQSGGAGGNSRPSTEAVRNRRPPRWEEDVPLAFYLRALHALG